MDKKGTQSEADMKLPQVDKILRHPVLETLAQQVRRDVIAQTVRNELDQFRRQRQAQAVKGIQRNKKEAADLSLDDWARRVADKLQDLQRGGVRRVINGTGVILSTNLGRAPMPQETIERLASVLPGYCSLEIDLETGKRGERTDTLEEIMCLLTGCQACLVVNNNAAAVMLAVTALSQSKEVIVSRGELIEIGGSFRLPDVIVSAGGVLKEVGTTNRTRSSDYQKAMNAQTGMVLKCHRSNYEITGFTEEASVSELVQLCRQHSLPFVEDLGSGALFDLSQLGIKYEPTVDSVLKTGVDLVLFSADKLLGAGQAGVVVGGHDLVQKLRSHPIYRALRADKLVIALLESVLAAYLSPNAQEQIPSLSMACESTESIRARVLEFIQQSANELSRWRLSPIETTSTFGGGTLPGQSLPSFGIAIEQKEEEDRADQTDRGSVKKLSSDKVALALRRTCTPVISIVNDDRVVVDFRTIRAQEEKYLLSSLMEMDSAQGASEPAEQL